MNLLKVVFDNSLALLHGGKISDLLCTFASTEKLQVKNMGLPLKYNDHMHQGIYEKKTFFACDTRDDQE